MLRKILSSLLFFIPIINFGQNSIESVKDTIINYRQDKKYYVLDLVGPDQHIYFDSIIYDNNQPITILIKNNTKDTVFISVKSLMSSKHLFSENSTRYIKPNECYSLSLKFYPFRNSIEANLPLNDHFSFSYSLNDQTKYFIFRMSGYVQLGTLPKFQVEEHPNLIIASSALPTSVIKEQNTETAKTPFEFRKELWIYPKSTTDALPANLTLKYLIDDSVCYAKKRLDTLNQIYFKIPSALGDSIYFVLTSPAYGFIAKKSFVRNEINDLTISFQQSAELSQPHYYNHSGNRVAIPGNWIGHYFIPRGISDTKMMMLDFRKHIDSLNTRIKDFDAEINYGLDGYILKCQPELAQQVKKRLGDFEIYQLIGERRWITDSYEIFFNSNLSKEKISEILLKYGVTDFFVNSTPDYGYITAKYTIYHIEFKLNNLPGSNFNNQIINSLLEQKEISKIVQWSIDFPALDD